jgi:hypothetical protein
MIFLRRIEARAPAGGEAQPLSTLSGASGQFALKGIEPGEYRLSASRSGYLTIEWGSLAPGRTGTILSMAGGQAVKNIVLRLTASAVVTGRVVDEDGRPIPAASAELLRYAYTNRTKGLAIVRSTSTDDRGEYRLSSVPPGKYFVRLAYHPPYSGSLDRSAAPHEDEDYIPVYYPGVSDPSAAAEIDVSAGSELRGIGFSLAKSRTFTVKGRVVLPASVSGRPSVFFYPSGGGGGSLRTITLDADGRFMISRLGPGLYKFVANLKVNGRVYSNNTMVARVLDRDPDSITITLVAGAQVVGRVKVDGETGADLSNLQVRLEPRGRDEVFPGMPGSAKLGPDGEFRFDEVVPDMYDVLISAGLPDGFYAKSIRSGGQDVIASGLDTFRGQPGAVEVVLSPRAGELTGTVQDPAARKAASGATVVLAPRDRESRDRGQNYFDCMTDQYGRFTLKNIPPGEYKAFAWQDVERGAWFDRGYMDPLESKGETVTVRESGRLTVQFALIDAVPSK